MVSCKEELKNMSSDETASAYRTLLACNGVVLKHVALACEEDSSHCIGNARILWSRESQAAVCIAMAGEIPRHAHYQPRRAGADP